MAAILHGSSISEEDKEEQADEIEALRSIYPEIVMIDENEESRCFELTISIAPVKSIPVLIVPRQDSHEVKEKSKELDHNTTQRRQKARACRVYGSNIGCKYGDQCKFLHTTRKKTKPGRVLDDSREENCKADTSVSYEDRAIDTGIRLTHLLPIVLRITFTRKYPSEQPPEFVLSSSWLTIEQIEQLRYEMLSAWENDCKGTPVVFTWIQYLESEEASNIFRYLVIEERQQSNEVFRNEMPDTMIDALVRYDRQILLSEFQKANHECEICLDDKPGQEFFRFESCGHFFCRDCLSSYIDVHLNGSAGVDELCCPSGSGRCSKKDSKRMLTGSEVLGIAGQEAREKFERLLLQQALSSMGDIVYCPRCQTPTVEESDSFGHCPKCRFAFCTLCFDSFHPGSQCITAEEAIAISRTRNAGGAKNFSPEEQERRKRLVQNAQSLAMIRKCSKQCPSCRSAVSKTRGCNKMACPCGVKFCYSCGKNITSEGYNHFGSQSCVLFDDEAIREWEQEMAQFQHNPEFHQGLQIRRAGGHFGNQGNQDMVWLHCPRCRQRNVRQEDGNNQIRCWACRTKFCASCRAVVLDAAKHYARGKPCRQHGGAVAVR